MIDVEEYFYTACHYLKVKCENTLREHLRIDKVFRKKQCFYLNYHKLSIKSYVLDVY